MNPAPPISPTPEATAAQDAAGGGSGPIPTRSPVTPARAGLRIVRRGLLLGLLVGACVALFLPSRDTTEIEVHWRRLHGPCDTGCAQASLPGVTRCWDVTLSDVLDSATASEFPGLVEAARLAFRERVVPLGCRWTHRVRLTPRWVRRPGFFSGLAIIELRVDLTQRDLEAGCKRSWDGRLTIDQGRRGHEEVAVSQTGRLVSTFLLAGDR